MDCKDEASVSSSEVNSVLDPSACSSVTDAPDSDAVVLDCVNIENSETVSLQAPKDSSTMRNCERGIGQSLHKFTFTRIFGPDTTQPEFFEGTIKDLVNSFVMGQNGLVFTYGVTNAGKTFTIQGSPKDGGILPRALDVLFSSIQGRRYPRMNLKPYLGNDVMKLDPAQLKQEEALKNALFSSLKEDGLKTSASSSNLKPCVSPSVNLPVSGYGDDQNLFQFSTWVSFFEIYNEYVYDLLDPFPSKNQKRSVLKICDDQSGTSYVKDLKWFNISSTDEACKILQIGNKSRSLASTRMNHQSSRSHSIFTVRLLKLSSDDDPIVHGVSEMSLCDLAGSERCNKTQTVGERLKEAGNINTSLLILGKCIAALKQSQNPKKNNYVPFRESKLTRLFQPFFCGRGKACMIVNINQCASTYDETLHVMKFSAVAKQVVQTIQPRNFDFRSTRIVGKDGKVITEIDANVSIEDLLSDDEDEEMDFSILSQEDLLKKIEELKEKLLAERQSKLILELQIRKEMGEAMYQQMVDLEENYSRRFEDLKDACEEQLESRLDMYKRAIKNHAYRQATEELDENYVSLDEFQAEQEKVEERDNRIKELEMALGRKEYSGEDDASKELNVMCQTLDAVTKRCEESNQVIANLKARMENLKDEMALNKEKWSEENKMLKQQLNLKEQEAKGLQNLAERAIRLEVSVAELQAEVDECRKPFPPAEALEPKPKKSLFSNIRNTMTGTPKKSKSVAPVEDSVYMLRKKPLLSRK
uniref:Kinesin-like protein n=1 Tax=Leptobrachium leishanense TaxID=445787 RepID=A0A8C5MF53_9ANUR